MLEPSRDADLQARVQKGFMVESEDQMTPAYKKALLNMLTHADDSETIGGQHDHEELARGGSDCYKALVKQLTDTELNTIYHRWTGHLEQFKSAQESDVRGHRMGYDPSAIVESIQAVLDTGPSIDELSARSQELFLATQKWRV